MEAGIRERSQNELMDTTADGFLQEVSDEDLVDVIRRILDTPVNLDFLLELKTKQLEMLAACIRDRVGHAKP